MLIDTAFFRDFNSVDDNVDSTDIDKKIFKAERKLRFLLGPAFFDEIETQYDSADDTSGLSTDNLALYDPYIKEMLASEAYVTLLERNVLQVKRGGLVVFKNEGNEPGSDKIVGEAIKAAKNEAEQFKNAMMSFIEGEQTRDSTKYPLFTCGSKRMGTQFHITEVKRKDHTLKDVNSQIIYGD